MSPRSVALLVTDTFDRVLRTTEDPFVVRYGPLAEALGLPRRTYREELDRVRVNVYGDPIPRIALVRNNIAQLYGWGPRATPRLPA